MSRVQDRVDDYLAFGVRYIWVIDPRTRRAWVYDRSGCVQPADGVLRTENPAFEVPLRDLFDGIDEMVG